MKSVFHWNKIIDSHFIGADQISEPYFLIDERQAMPPKFEWTKSKKELSYNEKNMIYLFSFISESQNQYEIYQVLENSYVRPISEKKN